MLDSHPLFTTPVEVPEDLGLRAKKRGWPDGLLHRALDIRLPTPDIEFLLSVPPADEAAKFVEAKGRLFDGPIRARETTWADWEALTDLYANASEDVGEWRVTVERGPNPNAQFRLQEHVNMQMLEHRGIALAAKAHSTRNSLIGGERYTVHVMSAWRVRDDFRGCGLSRLLQHTNGPANAWFGVVTVWYERSGNASQGWLDKIRNEMEARDRAVIDGLTATVHHIDARAAGPIPSILGIRPVTPADIPRCVELINRTHAGLDLFRPYSCEFLEERLNDPFWGPRPAWWDHVYSSQNHFVVVDDRDDVVACGGLWDRGEDVREVWRHKETAEERVLAPTALLDWGHAAGREDAMAALIRDFVGRTAELGRTHLLAPLEFAPLVLTALEDLEPRPETRALRSMGFHQDDVHVDPKIERPYTDVAYW